MIKNLFITLCFSTCVFLSAQSFIPNPPSLDVKSFILIGSKTNTIIASFNEDAPIEPASMTKVMSSYVVADQIKNNFLDLEDMVLISEKAGGWKDQKCLSKKERKSVY